MSMRVAIVNDMRMAVEALRRVVTSDPAYEVAWIAYDGEEAVRMCAADVPDVILMDLMMPRMDGAEACRHIMRDSPCAILVVTATVEGNSSKVFDAMGWGALDAVNTPVLGMSGEPAGASAVLTKLAMLGKLLGKGRSSSRAAASAADAVVPGAHPPLIAIGASTGGPTALATVLGGLPADLRAAVAIVQHVDECFAPGMASWLSVQSGRDVRIIKQDDLVTTSCVQMASTNDHLVLNPNLTLGYSSEPADFPYRPSVDVFFRTVAESWPGPAIGVLLTGMGSDGAQGLLAMRRAGWHTIAQDEASSVVYGMPKAAVQVDAAAEVLALNDIAGAIARTVPRAQARSRSRA
ncbi:MAG TPA: chemotaxis response regulator protein-glutamate methylesterase [Vicinamibacterales bacterium]|jgi:two-component system response regulator WspF|nr:chemotaxis response regulator protein-glutamate methylesterase [Vicinamibacterales bacterium]